MARLVIGTVWILCDTLNVFAEPPFFPANTRLLCRIDCASFVSSEVIRKDLEPWKAWTADIRSGLAAIGVNPEQAEQIWIGCGDDFPTSLVVAVHGQFDTKKLDAGWQQLVRDRRFNAKSVRNTDSTGFSLDLPPAVLPLPGLPNELVVTVAGPNAIVFGVNKIHVFAVSNPSAGLPRTPLEPQVVNDSTVSLIWKLPSLLTAPKSMMTGSNQIQLQVRTAAELSAEIRINCDSAEAGKAMAESIRAEAVQVQQVFPPLARQQGTDPRFVRLMMAFVAAAKTDVQEQAVVVRATLPGDEVKKLLAKP